MIKFFRDRADVARKARELGREEGMAYMRRVKNDEIKKIKKKTRDLLAEKFEEISRRDKRISDIEKHLEEFIEVFANAKYMADMIESREATKYARINDEFQETTGFAGRIRHLCGQFERRAPALKSKIEKYQIENIGG
jgi:hypothetical protein